MAYAINVTDEAQEDLSYYTVFERKTIVMEIRAQLTYQPLVETKNRKQLRDNPIATWELRVGMYRVFYEVDVTGQTVSVVSVGYKIHNTLWIRGQEVQL